MVKAVIYFALLILLASCSPSTHNQSYIHPEPETMDEDLILPPSWAFGVLYGGYTNQEESIERIKRIQKHGYPIDAYWIDSWFWSYDDKGIGPHKYIDFVADTVAYPNRTEMWSFMRENNIKGGFWIWDCIQETGNEEAFQDFKERGFFRDIYNNTNSWHNKSTSTAMHQDNSSHSGTPTGNIDFENPEAVAYFKERIKPMFDEGADFIKLDRTSAIPVCRAMFESTQELGQNTDGRGFIFSHTGGQESAEYKRYPGKWTDDTRMDWTVEAPTKEFNSWVPNIAFKENIAMFTDPSKRSSEIPFMAQDLGGFDMGITDELDEELYLRWMQFAMLTPITTVFTQPENWTANMPYNYSERADTLFKYYSNLRMKLFPYIYSNAHQSRLKGEHMLGKFPEHIYQYTLGKDLLIAPVYEQGGTQREVYFPEGTWIDYWTQKRYEGENIATVNAPIHQIPIFIKQGSIIPMREYANSIETGNNKVIHLHVYPGDDSEFALIEDDGSSNDYLEGIYLKTEMTLNEHESNSVLTIEPALGYYNGLEDIRQWHILVYSHKSISAIQLNGKNIEFEKSDAFNATISFERNIYKSSTLEIEYH